MHMMSTQNYVIAYDGLCEKGSATCGYAHRPLVTRMGEQLTYPSHTVDPDVILVEAIPQLLR